MTLGGLEQLRDVMVVSALCMARLLSLFLVTPFMSNQIFQGIVRNAVVLAFSLVLAPAVFDQMLVEPRWNESGFLTLVLLKEVLIGILMGFLVSVVFWVAEGVGFLIDNQRGTTMASVFDPLIGYSTSPFGSFFSQSITVFFFTTGGFLGLLQVFYHSFQLWPIFTFTPSYSPAFPNYILQVVDGLMSSIFLYASPIIIALFLTEFGLGLINRFTPQLNVFFLAMSVKSGVGIFILILYLAFLFELLKGGFHDFGPDIQFLKRLLP